ncbi:response regulator [Paenibacillus sp. LMG 31456]|uniref:Response regulator n=1 Tax=Paenibacillus foliorum TaxID=2654974 RepID=A0A972GT53_9BACL|nr:response regulator [Paenibacillus foliorum]NOU96386.1 response regulator [Paenibacillus foliorum]
MNKLIIVDDDEIIRKGLSKTIAWQELGFELSGTAGNGLEALSLVEKALPAIVITDIRMPHMDGLQLTEELLGKYPDMKIILMTSFEEFEFAKKALKLKVFDYLLKPFDNEMLLETVNRAVAELNREQTVRKKVIDSMPLLRQQFFENLILDRMQKSELETESHFLGINLAADTYMVAMIKIDEYHSPEHRNRFGSEMLKYCVSNITEELSNSLQEHCFVFNHDGDEVIVLFAGDDESRDIENKASFMMEEVRKSVEKYLKTTVTIGIGTMYNDFGYIHQSFLEAKAVLDFRHITGTNQVLLAQDIHLQPPIETISLGAMEKELLVKIKLGMERDALTIIMNLEQEVADKKFVSLRHLHLLGTEIALLIYREFWEWIHTPQMKERFGEFNYFCQNIQVMRTFKEIFATIKEFISELITEICARRDSHQKQTKHSNLLKTTTIWSISQCKRLPTM